MAQESFINTGVIPTEVTIVDAQGAVQHREATPDMAIAQQLSLTRPILLQELDPTTYERPLDKEVAEYKAGNLSLGEMTPSYAHAMVWAELKDERTKVKTFKDEMALAQLWKEKLGELASAFGLPEHHISIDTSGPIIHAYPVEVSGQTKGPNGDPLQFDLLPGEEYFMRHLGRGFEAILPTHVQSSGYATPAHPEMDSSVSAKDAIPSLQIGKYVRIGGSFNPQGSEAWKLGDNAWLGQGSYIISQEHPADMPSHLGRERSSTSFPGMEVGDWAWIAKEAKILYRTQYIGGGAVVASQAKINTWVSDHSLVTTEGHHTFYPLKSFVLDRLGIRDTQAVLSLDWSKVEALWQREYELWRKQEHKPDRNVAEALSQTRLDSRGRVLFIGSENPANILSAAAASEGKYPLRRIDVMTVNQNEQAFTMQALNGMHNRSTRFRKVDTLKQIPIGNFYTEPAYDLVIVEASAKACCDGGKEINRIFDEARRLVKPEGEIVGTLHDVNTHRGNMTLPEYIDSDDLRQEGRDTLAIHVQGVLNNNH